jgi:hypothetical protein
VSEQTPAKQEDAVVNFSPHAARPPHTTFLDKLLVMHTPEHKKYQSPFICTGAAIQAAKHLIEDEGKSSLLV